MQIVGRPCQVCQASIVLDPQGVACVGCGVAFHRRCLKDEAICEACGKPFAARVAELEREQGRSIGRGRPMAMAALISLPAITLVTMMHMIAMDRLGGQTIARLILTAGLAWAAYRGHRWAVVLVRVLSALSVLGYVVLIVLSLIGTLDTPAYVMAIAAYNAVVCTLIFVVLTAVGDVRRFLDRRRSSGEAGSA